MTAAKPIDQPTLSETPRRRSAGSALAGLEIDLRLLGMVGAVIVLWLAFNFMSGGLFLSPRNLWNLSVQSAAVAIMTSGMVLIIVSRNIDLSIGSVLGFTAMVMGLAQTEWIPNFLGPGFDPSFLWIAVVLLGIVVGAVIGGLQGYLVAYIGIPSFIVTLGGLLIWRGAAFQLAKGRTIAPLDGTFQLLGGGPDGVAGGDAELARRRHRDHRDRLRPDVLAPPAPAVRLRAPAALGRYDARRRGQPRGPGRRVDRQQLPVAVNPRRSGTPRRTTSRSRRAACRSRPGSRSRS